MKKVLLVAAFLILHVVPAYSRCPDGGPEPCGKYWGSYGSGCPDGGPPPCGKYGGGGCPDGGPPPCGIYGGSSGGGSGSYGGSSSSSKSENQATVKTVVVTKSGSIVSGTIIKSTPDIIILQTSDGQKLGFFRKEVKKVIGSGGESAATH